MVHLVKKIIKGNTYLYLEETAWINGKSTIVWQKYLGSESTISEQTRFKLKPEFFITTLDFGLPCILMQIVKNSNLSK